MVSGLEESVIHETKTTSIVKDDDAIQNTTTVIKDRLGNPFLFYTTYTSEKIKPISNITTGVVSSVKITDSLLNAKESMLIYVDDCISNGSTLLHLPIKKL